MTNLFTGSLQQQYQVTLPWSERPDDSTPNGETVGWNSTTKQFELTSGGPPPVTGVWLTNGLNSDPAPLILNNQAGPISIGTLLQSLSLEAGNIFLNNVASGGGNSTLKYDTVSKQIFYSTSLTGLRSTTTNQYEYDGAVTTPPSGHFGFDAGRFYFHKTDLTGRDATGNFTYLNGLLNARIPSEFLLLDQGGTITPAGVSVVTVGDVFDFEGSTVLTLVVGDKYTIDQVVIKPERIILDGGNDATPVTIGSNAGIGSQVDIRVGNAVNYTLTNTVMSTAIANYENNVVADNDIPNKKYVDDLANNNILDGGNTTGATVTIGTNDNNTLALEVNNANRLTLNSNGSSVYKNTSIVQLQSDSNFIFQNTSGLNNALVVHPDNGSVQIPASNITMSNIADVQTSKMLYWDSVTGAVTRGDLPTTAVNILDGGNPKTSAISFGPTQLNCFNQWADAHDFIGLNSKSLFKYRQIQYGAAPVVQQVWQQLQPDTYQFVYNCSEPTVGGVEGTIFSLAGGNTNQTPQAKGGYISFAGGACYTTPNVSLLNPAYWGDILFSVGNFGANGRNLRMSGTRSGVLQIETGTGLGSSPAYETLCTQPQDIPNNAYITANFLSPSNTATVSNKFLVDATTRFQDDADPTKNARFEISSVAPNTTRVLTIPNRDGSVLVNAIVGNIPFNIALAPTANDLIRFDGTNWVNTTPSYIYAVWNANATSSGGTQNRINWIQGTYTNVGSQLFSAGASNAWTYTGTRTTLHEISYMMTPIVGSNDRTLKITAYKNPDQITNPTVGLIAGSTTTSIIRTTINDTVSVSNTFAVSLATNDIIRFYVSNVENADASTIVDLSIKIKNVV